MRSGSRNEVSRILEGYAQRGVFRSYSEIASQSVTNDVTEFRFVWLTPEPLRVVFDATRDALIFEDLLPGVHRESELAAELKAFIRSLTSPGLPDHRRLDPTRLRAIYRNRQGRVSLAFLIQGGDFDYGVRKAVNVVNEIFLSFLTVYHPPYMVKHFQMWDE